MKRNSKIWSTIIPFSLVAGLIIFLHFYLHPVYIENTYGREVFILSAQQDEQSLEQVWLRAQQTETNRAKNINQILIVTSQTGQLAAVEAITQIKNFWPEAQAELILVSPEQTSVELIRLGKKWQSQTNPQQTLLMVMTDFSGEQIAREESINSLRTFDIGRRERWREQKLPLANDCQNCWEVADGYLGKRGIIFDYWQQGSINPETGYINGLLRNYN